eukprot:11193537-Lingulodinium_polyedra.AAC.1
MKNVKLTSFWTPTGTLTTKSRFTSVQVAAFIVDTSRRGKNWIRGALCFGFARRCCTITRSP